MGQRALQGFWQLGPFRMIYMILAALGLDQKKQLCKALDRNELVNMSESKLAVVLCLSHTGWVGQKRVPCSHSYWDPPSAAKTHWLMVCIKRQGTDFCQNYVFRTVHNSSVYWKEILLTAATQWAVKNITTPNYQKELSETAAFSLNNKKAWINN